MITISKQEMEQEMKMTQKEPLEEIAMVGPLFQVKEEPPSDEEESLTSYTSNQPANSLIRAIKEEVTKAEPLAGPVASSLASPSSSDDIDSMPNDWFAGASSDSEEAIVDAPMTISADSLSNCPIKEEPHPDSVSSLPIKEEPHPEELLSIFASTQLASPLIVVKGETCLCTVDGLDCFDCLEAKQTDTDEAIVEPVAVSAAPVSNSCATTSQRSPPCPECGKTFWGSSNLKRHLRVHTGERPYVCTQCPKAFNELGNLKKHQVIHQAVRRRPFHCTAEGCGKDFLRKGDMTLHLRRHMNDKPYKCANCPMAFISRSELTLHFRSHTGDKPYKCDRCPKAFIRSYHLTVHLGTHTGQRLTL